MTLITVIIILIVFIYLYIKLASSSKKIESFSSKKIISSGKNNSDYLKDSKIIIDDGEKDILNIIR